MTRSVVQSVPRRPVARRRGQRMLTMHQTMEALACNRQMVMHLHRLQHLRGVKLGRSRNAPWRFSAESVDDFASRPPARIDMLATVRPEG